MYRIFKQTGDGKFVHVTSRGDVQEAVQVLETFNFEWPGKYVVRDLEGNEVCNTEEGTVRPGPLSTARTASR